MTAEEIKAALRNARISRGMNQMEVVRRAGGHLGQSGLSGYETGRRFPGLDRAVMWAKAVGMELTVAPAGTGETPLEPLPEAVGKVIREYIRRYILMQKGGVRRPELRALWEVLMAEAGPEVVRQWK